MIFNLFPKIEQLAKEYKQPTKGHLFQVKQYQLVRDILDKYELKPLVVNDSDRPEFVAYNLYGQVEYFWLVLMCNNMIDPYFEWILPSEQVIDYAKQRYKNLPQKENTIYFHRTEDDKRYYNVVEYPENQNMWYDRLDTHHRNLQYKGVLIPITYLEWEFEKNEEKRIVKALDPNDFQSFVQELIQEGILTNGEGR